MSGHVSAWRDLLVAEGILSPATEQAELDPRDRATPERQVETWLARCHPELKTLRIEEGRREVAESEARHVRG